MDRMNNNFNPFDFDVEAFTRAYYQQGAGQQSEDARQRTSFEEQLGELKLGSSDESSGGNGSLAAFSGECSGGVRRDMGASMRTPPRFASSDSSSNSSRHSVDIPDPVSSPEIQIKKGKKRGMWSRIKSAVGKSSSGSHSEKAFGAPKQQEIVSTNVQVYCANYGNRLGAFEEDEALVETLPASPHEFPPTPASPRAEDWNWLREQMQEPAPYPWSAPSDFYGGPQAPFNMSPPTPYGMPDYAPGHAGQRDEAGPSRQGAADLGYLIPGGWEHYERWLPGNLTQALEDQHLMPAPGRPTHFNISGVPYMAALVERDGRSSRVRIYPEGGASPSTAHARTDGVHQPFQLPWPP
ncbi:hypothetical protein [Rhizobium ruizarguesonis]